MNGDFRELCVRLCETLGWELLSGGIRIPLPAGRHQLVELDEFTLWGREMVRLTTTVGRAERIPTVRHGVALRTNVELAYGAFALRDDELVMVETFAADGADPEGFEAIVRYLAETADAWEARIVGGDEH